MSGEAGETAADRLPWWQRPRKLRRQLSGTFVAVAFTSVAIVGGLNLYGAVRLLDDGNRESLSSIGEAQARTIESGTERLLDVVSTTAADLAVADAIERLTEGFAALEDATLDDDQASALEAFYDSEVIAQLDDAGLGPVRFRDLAPSSDAGRYLQYHYARAPEGGDLGARSEVLDAGDGSTYSDAHREWHPYLAGLASTFGASDLLLISADGTVVYSVQKRIDLGTSLRSGPYAESELAGAVLEDLVRVRVGSSVIADWSIYLPGGGRPRSFAVASVRSETEIIGSLALQIPIEALNTVTAADGRWEDVGLRGGESYLVGSDLVLRSESREWIEDPDGYLDRVEDEDLERLISAFGSPVGLQPVDTGPVRDALAGRTFEGSARNYLGRRTYTYATPVVVAGVEWVAVVDIPLSDARSPLVGFVWRLGLVVLVVLPAAAGIGILLSRRLTRQITPVVDAADAIAAGERGLELPDLGGDELGDLARRLGRMSEELSRQEQELEEEAARRRAMLLTALPERMVDDEGRLVGTADVTDTATVVSVRVEIEGVDLPVDDGDVELLVAVARIAEEAAARSGLERIRVSADHHLFVAGMAREGDGARVAMAYAAEVRSSVESLAADEEVPIGLHIAASTGPTTVTLLEVGRLALTAWGPPVRRALAISALVADPGTVVDGGTAEAAATSGWEFESIGVHDLGVAGPAVELFGPVRLDTPV